MLWQAGARRGYTRGRAVLAAPFPRWMLSRVWPLAFLTAFMVWVFEPVLAVLALVPWMPQAALVAVALASTLSDGPAGAVLVLTVASNWSAVWWSAGRAVAVAAGLVFVMPVSCTPCRGCGSMHSSGRSSQPLLLCSPLRWAGAGGVAAAAAQLRGGRFYVCVPVTAPLARHPGVGWRVG